LGNTLIFFSGCKLMTMPDVKFKSCRLSLLALAGCFLTLCLTSCTSKNFNIRFIVPDNFNGLIVITQDENLGLEPRLVDHDIYQFDVPNSGLLQVKSTELFHEYHFSLAKRQDGSLIPSLARGTNGKPIVDYDLPALHSIGTVYKDNQLRIYYCIGNDADYHNYRKQLGFE